MSSFRFEAHVSDMDDGRELMPFVLLDVGRPFSPALMSEKWPQPLSVLALVLDRMLKA